MAACKWIRSINVLLLACVLCACQPEPDDTNQNAASESQSVAEAGVEAELEAEIDRSPVDPMVEALMQWREGRVERLTQPYGWLSLVGYYALDRQGEYSLGRAESNDLVVPGGPDLWGQIVLTGETVRFESADTGRVTVDDEPLASAELLSSAFTEGEPTRIESDGVRVQLSRSGGIPNLRVRSPDAKTRTEFVGIDYFEPSHDYRFEAEFIPHEPGKTMRVANVMGQIIDEDNPGIVRFQHEGEVFELETFQYGERLFIVFADRTSGFETYGLGRFLYANLPEDGKTMINFNFAYNPPCAFSEYTTCSLPPQSNRMDTRIEAGEKAYRGIQGMTEAMAVPPPATP